MKNLTLIILFILCGTINSYASHAMGADLTYEHITGNTYRATLKFYRDCSGISAPFAPMISVSSSCSSTTITLNQVGYRILPTSCGQTSSCFGGSLVGAEEYIYQGLVTVNPNCTDWTFGYDLCCRNGAITTLVNPQGHSFYIEAKLSNPSQVNNSPEFTGLPVIYVGTGQQVIYNHGVIDPDGDQLVFSLTNGLDGPSASVNYQSGLSGLNPLYTTGPTTINSQTGQVTFTPSVNQVGVLSVKVEEYRNNQKIGEVTRDMQIIVASNSNTGPIVSGINGTANASGTTGPYATTIQSGSQYCFNLQAFDAEGNTIALTATVPPAAVFTSTPGSNTGQFCWTPTASDVGTHLITVFASDNGCPYQANNSYTYQITVNNANGQCNGAISNTINNSTVNFQYTGSTVVSYHWDFGDGNSSSNVNPTYTYSAAGTYSVQLTTVGANNQICVYAVTVQIHTNGTCDATFTYDSDFFYPNFVSTIADYYWDFGDGTTSNQMQPQNLLGPGTWTVCLELVNCGDSCNTCQVITIPSACDGTISSTEISHFTYQFQLTNTTSSPIAYNWEFGDGNSSTLSTPVYTYGAAGNYLVTLNTIDSMGNQCQYSDSLNVCPTTGTCDASFTYSNGLFAANDVNNSYYFWNFGDGSYGYQSTVQHTYNQSGTYLACLSVSTPLGDSCQTCDTIIVQSPGACDASFTYLNGTLIANDQNNQSYTWFDGYIAGPVLGTQSVQPVNLQPGTHQICLTTQTILGDTCNRCDSIYVPSPGNCNADFTHINGIFTANDLNNSYYFWDFGDGSYGYQPIEQHTYSQSGTYLACLNVSTPLGDSCQTCDSIFVQTPPPTNCDAGFTYNGGLFAADVVNSQNDYFWDFGDGTYGNGAVTQHGYAPGTYIACLDVTTMLGDSCIECDTIYIAPPQGCNSDFTYVNGIFTANDLNNSFYFWDFGDGSIGTGAVTQHGYTPGTYVPCLYVETAFGDSCQTCDTIYVQTPPVSCNAGFSYINGALVADELNNSFYSWTNNGTNLGNLPVQPLNYPAGIYDICLYTETVMGDSCQICDTIFINNIQLQNISLNLYPNPTTNEITIDFVNRTAGASTITVQNAAGDMVLRRELFLEKGEQNIPINLDGFAAGLYFVTVQNDTLLGRGKVVKIAD